MEKTNNFLGHIRKESNKKMQSQEHAIKSGAKPSTDEATLFLVQNKKRTIYIRNLFT